MGFNSNIRNKYEKREINYKTYEQILERPHYNNTLDDLFQKYEMKYDDWGSILIDYEMKGAVGKVAPTLQNFRYAFMLFQKNTTQSIERANELFKRIFTPEIAKYGSMYAQTIFSGYNGVGGFHEYFPRKPSAFYKYPLANHNFHLDILPYLILIRNTFQNSLEQNTKDLLSDNLRFITDILLRNDPEINEFDDHLLQLLGILMINSDVKAWNLQMKSYNILHQLVKVHISENLFSNMSLNERITSFYSLYIIQQYIQKEYHPIIKSWIKEIQITEGFFKEIENMEISNNLSRSEPIIDLYLFLDNQINEVEEKIENYSILEPSELNQFQKKLSKYQMREELPLIIILVIFTLFFIPLLCWFFTNKIEIQKNVFEQINNTKNNRVSQREKSYEELFYPNLNYFSEILSTSILPVIVIIFVSKWHYGWSLYFILFLWPISLIYGFKTNRSLNILFIFGILILFSINLYSIFSWSAILIILQFIYVFILDMLHTIYLISKMVRNKKVSHGYHNKTMILLLLFTVFAEGLYVVLFLTNRYIYATPNILTFGFFFKTIVVLRTKYG